MPDPEDEERFSIPGDFEENLRKVLEVDPEELEDSEEEPEQGEASPSLSLRLAGALVGGRRSFPAGTDD